MSLLSLKKSIRSVIDYMLYIEKIPPQEVELALRLEVDEIIDSTLEEYEIDLISNIRLEDLDEEDLPEELSILEILISQEKTFDEVWDFLITSIKKKNKD